MRLGIVSLALGVCLSAASALAGEVVLFDKSQRPGVVYDPAIKGRTFKLAAEMLAGDLEALTGVKPNVATRLDACDSVCIVIGRIDSPILQGLIRDAGLDISTLKGAWERYGRAVIQRNGRTLVLVYGSDTRGAIYGVTDLSRALGVSPWTWWADVAPRRVERLALSDAAFQSPEPSVKYRGIFLNDEDWGLQPWATSTFEPEVGNIGPKTYGRVFELMWRLKANTIWPAMHTVSTPFYGIKDNPRVADDYAITVGTSHAEPLMRNNLREWDEASEGPFNFKLNRAKILDYWRQRLRQSQPYEGIYTVGLRGLHDGPMQGADTLEARMHVLEDVIDLQRDLMARTLRRKAETVPQTYVLYHELQEAYDAGLKLPEDVTLMWADDNYGYIRRLSDAKERQRSGGSGVYYHLSYWGRPHDYLWLGSTHPALIQAEMQKAHALDANRIWIVNVGDIKPIEYLTQYFLDLAFDVEAFQQSPRAHLEQWMTEQFGPTDAAEIADIMMGFYDLAFTRKPEFMGFSETEPVTSTTQTDFTKPDGESAHQRLAAYADLTRRAELIQARMPEDRQAAFFELVLYPVRAAANLNGRILNLDLAHLYARQGRASANLYSNRARSAHLAIKADTEAFNGLVQGKWRGMMDMAPRRLPVFQEPTFPQWSTSVERGCASAVSGGWWNDENALTFVEGQPKARVIELFSYQAQATSWSLSPPPGAFAFSQAGGTLNPDNGYAARVTVRYDGTPGVTAEPIDIRCGDQSIRIFTKILPKAAAADLVESDRRVVIPAAARIGSDWEKLDGLGHTGAAIRSRLDLESAPIGAEPRGAPLTYQFSTVTAAGGVLDLIALPTHALNPTASLRIAVQLDDQPVETVNFATVGRSDEWRGNVLTNTAIRRLPLTMLSAGLHDLKIWPLDPGVVLDRAEVRLDGADKYYGLVK